MNPVQIPAHDTPEAIKKDVLKAWHRSLDRRLELIALDLEQLQKHGRRTFIGRSNVGWTDWSEMLDQVNRLTR